jgi:hypothetical protein
MIHQRQRLPLSLKSRDHLLRVHAELDDFQRDLANYRLALLGHIHHTHSALANYLEQLVPPNHRPGLFAEL